MQVYRPRTLLIRITDGRKELPGRVVPPACLPEEKKPDDIYLTLAARSLTDQAQLPCAAGGAARGRRLGAVQPDVPAQPPSHAPSCHVCHDTADTTHLSAPRATHTARNHRGTRKPRARTPTLTERRARISCSARRPDCVSAWARALTEQESRSLELSGKTFALCGWGRRMQARRRKPVVSAWGGREWGADIGRDVGAKPENIPEIPTMGNKGR